MTSAPHEAKAGSNNGSEAAAPSSSPNDITERTVENAIGQNVVGDFLPSDLYGIAGELAASAVKHPLALAKATLGFWEELGKLAIGEGTRREPPAGDKRFADQSWQDSSLHSALLQGYFVWRDALSRYAEEANIDERGQFLLGQLGEAFAPSNFLLGNPVALRHIKETKGKSLLRGVGNMIGDIRNGRPIPSQVDESKFQVGENLAVTPGSVVLRTEMFELIQYAPQTAEVHARPILLMPSIVNKFYIFDIAPKRSILEYFIQKGHSVFVMAWRNPQKRHDRWGMVDYQDALEAALDATISIAGSSDVNLWAVCGAGPVAVSFAGYLAAKKQRKVNSLLLVVSPLDTKAMAEAPSLAAFVDQEPEKQAGVIKKAARNKRISANEFTVLFAMLRPNDLIWNYWVNNYLLGNTPAAFDVLYWNGDGTGMTAQFNHDFSEFVDGNPFVTDGAMSVRDTPIAPLSELNIDSYVLGAATDHLCVWQSVYRSAQMLGPRAQFVLGNSGHIQTIVCPPGNPKASFYTNDNLPATAEEWLTTATKNPGSWWDHGVAWTAARAGEMIPAPKTQGNDKYPVLCASPGTYVHERG